MLENLEKALVFSENYKVSPEDVLFIDFSLSGVKFPASCVRIRFGFHPQNNSFFRASTEKDINDYFFALPVTRESAYHIEGDKFNANGELLGNIKDAEEDTCDSSYLRRKGTVFVFNPLSKSSCYGCKFCHTIKQTPRDRKSIITEDEVKDFFRNWLKNQHLVDLSHLIQVSIVTGCFGSEQKLVEYLKMVKGILTQFGFNGILFYYGSEITSEKSLEELRKINPFTLCVSVECFADRGIILRSTKGRLTSEDIKKILAKAKEYEFGARFSYILGIEPLEVMEFNFVRLLPYINAFPVINVFQIHRGQENLRFHGAREMEYYLEARKIIEGIFMNTTMRPNPWENYRSLWHLNFGKEYLNDFRTP